MPALTSWLYFCVLLLNATFVLAHFNHNNNSNTVQFILSNESSATKLTNSNKNATKAATRRDSLINLEHLMLENAAHNFNNQQNVKEIIRIMDGHLLDIRKDELCVTDIQAIFDSFKLNGDVVTRTNKSDTVRKKYLRTRDALLQDLHEFSARLEEKLQKASHVVLDLRDFFRYNMTQIMQQRLTQKQQHQQHLFDDNTSSNSNLDNDYEIDDVENLDEYTKLYLSSIFIQPFYEHDDDNKDEQIELLNILKSEPFNEHLVHNYLKSNTEISLEMNNYIADKMQSIKQELLRTNEVYELNNYDDDNEEEEDVSTSARKEDINNGNIKFLGSHFRHIFFLSASEHVAHKSENIFYNTYFRQLYVAAIQKKFICLLIDVGAGMPANLLEQARAFGN